jgi:excisionase family DNA binding protein
VTVQSSQEDRKAATGPSASRAHLSVDELCWELGIARSTFYDWRAAHKAPRCIKLPNGAIRIRRRDLDAWLETHEEPA